NSVAAEQDILACSDIGRVGYYYTGRVFDWWGLASPEVVARNESLGRIRPETVLSQRPRFIVLYSGGPDIFGPDGLTAMGELSARFIHNEEFMKNYGVVGSYEFAKNRYYVLFQNRSYVMTPTPTNVGE
ncbi:MAG: hypothetical protein J0M12_13210, partial [Deltaproteobacteria bacterium]|nr:hypothetical protein [Deltaproteobacteria bacterium]